MTETDSSAATADERFAVREELRQHYSGYYADGVSEWRRIGARGKAENLFALCRGVPHDSVLEIGAGDGALLAEMEAARFGSRLHALDISESAIECVESRGLVNLERCAVYDGFTVPFEDGRFDLVVLSHVLEHVEFPRRLVYEAARVGRHVFIEVPLELNARLKRDFVFDSLGHINAYSPKTIRREVQSCGMEVLEQIVVNPPLAAYRHRSRLLGPLAYAIKEATLRVLPPVATSIWTYHSALLCRRSGAQGPT